MQPYDKYEAVIGLEVHVQLSTASKAFCGDDASFGGAPNTHTSAISLGHPGTLPKLNEKQLEYAIRLGLALNSSINKKNYFDRKNYFYADLPKGYQITQDNQPICIGGCLNINTDDQQKPIRIHHIHMEEDAGKSIHDQDPNYSLIDLNRAGVPLLEIVTEPDFRFASEVDTFMNLMRQLVRYLEISDGNMEHGSMRCDCNISIRLKGESVLNERCEVKNINSMRFARQAIEYEFKRQVELVEAGGKVAQQTLNFDPKTGITSPLREKEDAHDYRYFPEPDLLPVVLSDQDIDEIRQSVSPLPWEIREVLVQKYNLTTYEANLISEEKPIALFYKKLANDSGHYKAAANLVINKIRPFLNENNLSIDTFPIEIQNLSAFVNLIENGKVSSSIAYQRLFPAMIAQPEKSPKLLAETLNLIQSDDSDFLEKLIAETIEKNPDKVTAYRNGKKGLIGFFMGEVMRQSKGKAAPKTTNELLRKMLDI
jgi:aspartyl-tRNA(Asn)/glutamyl-tRNA(Gln) amidotransferase subunit B